MLVYFNTTNPSKVEEFRRIFGADNPHIGYLGHPVTEILDTDLERVVRAKAAAAYRASRLPVIVEHGGLFIEHLNGVPGALVKPTWDLLQARLCDLVPPGASRAAQARSAVCYCDGQRRRVFLATIDGTLAESARGGAGFHWNPVFVPQGETRTLAEMTLDERVAHVPAAKACAALREELGI